MGPWIFHDRKDLSKKVFPKGIQPKKYIMTFQKMSTNIWSSLDVLSRKTGLVVSIGSKLLTHGVEYK